MVPFRAERGRIMHAIIHLDFAADRKTDRHWGNVLYFPVQSCLSKTDVKDMLLRFPSPLSHLSLSAEATDGGKAKDTVTLRSIYFLFWFLFCIESYLYFSVFTHISHIFLLPHGFPRVFRDNCNVYEFRSSCYVPSEDTHRTWGRISQDSGSRGLNH